jgi:hypothetical protein
MQSKSYSIVYALCIAFDGFYRFYRTSGQKLFTYIINTAYPIGIYCEKMVAIGDHLRGQIGKKHVIFGYFYSIIHYT